ncbi:hypothetical protein ACFZB4_00910 [Streptomyces pseudovenezuelae]|uniref:hypothetical protein n=1 Tax=Streptomyces pseudovenezuelae TaxID=67350 RepID=UPI0036E8FF83
MNLLDATVVEVAAPVPRRRKESSVRRPRPAASRWLARVVPLLGEPMNLLDATVVEVAASAVHAGLGGAVSRCCSSPADGSATSSAASSCSSRARGRFRCRGLHA